jgi:molybdate transport system substrate-binding protein
MPMKHYLLRFALLAVVAAALSPALGRRAVAADDLLVFAATTLKPALDDVADAYRRSGGGAARISYAPSSALVQQLDAGAPAELFISADADWMDAAAAKALIRKETRVDLLTSRLVLVAPRDSAVTAEIKPGFPLADLLAGGRLAMCDPMMMPAGRYARAALQTLGVWSAVKDRVANAESVRAALTYVARGEAPLAVVFDTDAAADPDVKVVGVFPSDSHPPIVYPAALTAVGKDPEAPKFLAFLQSAEARAIFERRGYAVRP